MENYWLKRLEHIQVPDWPYTSPDTVTVTFTVPVPPAVMQAMQAVAGNSSVNMLKLLLGGLGVVLWKYTGLQHAAIALPPLALPGENADDNSTLYCVLHLYATLQVPALLEQVHEALNDAHLHAGYNETTFRDAFRAANNDRLLAGNVALSYDGLTAPDNWLHEHQLHFEFNAAASHIKVNARNLPLPEKMLRNMAESLLFVAASFSANKEKSIAQCATEPPQSLHAWMARFNDHRRQYATGLTVVDLFLQQALEHPENTALVFGDTVYSYGGLDEWSARIAAYILQHTSRSQPLFIGVMMHRSAALVAAVLGILRAGAAYVPIDPAYPADRKKSIVADTQCPLIITDDDASATGIEICSIVNIATVTAVTAARPLPQVVPADVAYVIFSSGTTGKPKGIMIQHQAILNLLYWYNERYDLAAGAKIAQLTNIAVDIAFQEIFSSLMNGLPLYIPRQEEQQDRHVFVEWLKHHEISFIQLIPDMLATYLQDIPRITTLKQILCGGDKLSESLKDEIVSKGYTLYNIYGQTETAIDTVGAICRYGEPMCFNDYVPNYDVYILDEHGHLCPEYVAGEICTGGQGLALGYLHNPVLTAERFIAHPFEPGRRLYRTGDRARRMPDGSILLLGREDEQVKIRGYRIELGEIEGLLQRFPGIDNAAVIVKEDSTGEKQLAAFLAGSGQLDIQACRAYVKEHLPSYMLPDHFLQLDKLPLTDTGKIDRKRLAAYEGMKPSPSTGYVAPRNETEAQLADMWQQVIGKEKVGVTDDFFDLGGHSLKVTRLGSLIRKTFGVAVSLKDLFVHSVLEAQAALIAESRKEQQQAIPVLPLQDSYELSSSQHRLWVLSQLEGSNIAYNMPGVLVFEGVLDKEALFSAFTMLVARHEILRTVFRADPAGTVKQYVLDATLLNFRVKEQDLRGAEQQEELLQSCLAGDFYTEFDLAAGPLLRAGLYRLTDSKWVFSYVMHHIISDDWSMGVFFNDLLRLYNGFTGGGEALPPLRIQYKDYASWQRSRLTGTGTGKAYWQEVFSGDLPVLELPSDRSRPSVKTYSGGLEKHRFSVSLTQKLHGLLRTEGSTLFMGLVSAVTALLYRYTGQEDIIIGSPVAGRGHGDLEDQIGYYVNMLALRYRFSGEEGFGSLLRGVKEQTLGAYAHQDYPFDALVSDLGVQHTPGRNALFDVVVALQNAAEEQVNSSLPAGLQLHAYTGGVKHVSSKFDLLFNFQESGGMLHLALEYSSDLFDASTVRRMVSHLEGLLEAVTEDAAVPLCRIAYLGAEERNLLTAGYNDTEAGYPSDKSLVSLLEAQVLETPAHTALVYEGDSMSYTALNEAANRLGHYLRDRYGIGAGDLVGVKLDRGLALVVSLLAILKAGGAYVPIDPAYPQDRIDYILSDSGCKVLIDDNELSAYHSCADSYSCSNPAAVNSPDDLAYVIYTSGTTGRPKGVLISHRNVVRLLHTDRQLFEFGSDDVWTLFHSCCFDFSVWEMYGALLFGGRLVIVPLMTARDPSAFLSLLYREKVTVLNQTPSAFYNLVSAEEERGDWSLGIRYVIFGGEALSPGRLDGWHSHYPSTRLINMYGITETTVHVTYKEISSADIAANISNIGVPIPTLRTYVLDSRRELVPAGVWGELYVGGAGVSRGYLNREELTGERFMDSWLRAGERLYRSGDRVRWLPHGEMEYGGRFDEQVKIRGYRIELGEIASTLESHGEVSRALVIARPGTGGLQELVAYVICPETLSPEDLRSWLGRRLPDYMLPAGFVRLEALPLTANGKIDRKKLPGVEAGRQPGSVYTVPENEMQQLLLEVWQQVLGLNTIGIHDNFFSIGGNSISMIEIIAKARQQQVEITVRQVFEYPTIAMLAQAAKRKENTAAGQEAVTGAMPLLPIQRWYFEHQQQDVHHFNYAVMLTAPEELTSRRFFALTAALVDKHDALRLRFPHWEEGTAWHEPFSEKLLHSIATVEDYCDFVPVERTALVNTHAAGVQESLSIADGPLCRLVWYNYGAGSPGRLLLVAHHLLVDGISWRLLIDDLNRLLAQASGDQTFIPGGKSDSYKRWAEQLQAYATGERLLMERSYWHAVLNDAVDPFPAGSGTADRSIANQRQLVVGLDQAETRNLVYHCAKAYNTHINDLLLTALMTAICRWGNISSFLVHLEGHGREDIFEGTDVSQTVGWFTSIYPVLLNKGQINLETPHGIGTALRSVKENLRAVPANGLGYGVLRYLAQDADIAACERRRPAAVLFNYLGDFTQARNQAAVAMSESAGNTISGRQHALYSLEFNGAIIDNCLRFAISYLEGEYPVEDTTRLAGCFRQALQEVISHCMAVKRTHFTPSDFPLAALGQEKIDELEESFPEMQEVYPATSMQKAMFFHSLVADDEGAYVVQQHGRLKNIDPALFKLSWSRLVERHSMLRTAFVLCEKNGLLQVVSGRTEVQASYINCRDLSGAAWEAQLAACMEADAQTPFDFEKAPLFRYTILQRDEQDFHILLTLHHIILDGWSMPVLFAELNEVYQALSRQQPVMLPPVPSYGKYVDWLLTRSQAKALEFWKNQGLYAGQVSRLALQEGAASGIQEEGYREWHTVFTTAESSLLKNAAAKYEVTLHTLLVAAWARLLSDYTHAGEVMFGMTISGRSEAFEGISAMVGLFINTIPVKVACPVDEPLQEWLLALHRQQMEYNQYGAVGLSDIRRLNGINQDVPLFESLLVHQNYPGLNSRKKEDNAPAFEFSNAGFRDNNNSPLTIMVFSGQPLSFLINYKTEMFEHGFIENIAADYRKYLIDIARGEEVTINNLKTTW